MILYRSKFLEVNLLEVQYVMHFLWREYARHMDEKGVYYETLNFLKHRVRRRADSIYMDWRNIQHLVSRETFDWYEQYVLPQVFSHRPHKLAFLFNPPVPFELPGFVTVHGKRVPVRAFTSPSDLMAWLTEGAPRRKRGSGHH
ncbi:MAG: hypothetical protein GXO27_06390 [Chlorobi bacterium]|nr:hypothetical protein [Chlorobiota bacterium]